MGKRSVKQYEIYMYDFGVVNGSIQNGYRPVVVVQDTRFNKNSPTTIVAAITSAVKKEYLPSHIFLGQQFGLSKPSMVLLEQIHTVSQCDLKDYIGTIDDLHITRTITNGLKKTMGMWNYVPKDKSGIRCLCTKCMHEYMNAGSYIVRRLDPFQNVRETCDRCNRPGFDYVIIERKKSK